MATITAAMVKELRARTDVAMMKCKKALEECGGDMEAAVDFLRKTAGAAQDKKSERETKAGGIGLALGAGAGCLVQLACETDFVSGNDQFKAFVTALAEAALAAGVETTEGLQGLTIDDQSFNDALAQQVQRHRSELPGGAALQEQHPVVVGDGEQLAQIRLGLLSDAGEGFTPMAHLHHRGAGTPPVQEFGLGLLENGRGHHGGAGAEIEGTCHETLL